MHYEILCSVIRAAGDSEDRTEQALLEAVTAFEKAIRHAGLAAVVQVRDLRGGHTLHESVHPGRFVPPPHAAREKAPLG